MSSNLESRRGLAIGPLNQAGQAFYWAEAVRSHLSRPAFSFAPSGGVARAIAPGAALKGKAHFSVPHPRLAPERYRQARLRYVVRDSTRVLIESFVDTPGIEADGYIAHGSDLRDPDRHMARLSHSYFREAPEEWRERLRVLTRRNRELAADNLVYVSTPDLLLDCPHAVWLPLCVDRSAWANAPAALNGDTLTVLHVPSRRVPPIKGTQYVDRSLRRLASDGHIRYVTPHGVPHSQMPRLVRSADIVIDQILTGSYGVAAVEAMTAGRLVIGGIAEDVRTRVPDAIPVVDASPSDLAEVILDVLARRSHYGEIARAGVSFSSRWHDGRAAASVLEPLLAQ